MKKRNKLFVLLGVIFALALFLAACGNDNGGTTDAGSDDSDQTEEVENGADEVEDDDPADTSSNQAGGTPDYILDQVQMRVDHSGTPIEGGTLNFGVVATDPFTGIFHPLFSTNTTDSNIMQFFMGGQGNSILSADDDFHYDNASHGVASWELEETDGGGLIVRITIRDGIYWHDGVQLTGRDYQFAFEVMANPEYTEAGHVRFDQNNEGLLLGIEEFRSGDADYIAGVRLLDDGMTVELEFVEVINFLNAGIWSFPLAYHIFGDMDIADMSTSDAVRTDPIGFGPFIVETITPGESLTLSRNEDYWQGVPYLEEVIIRRIHSEMVGVELETGGLDMVDTFLEALYPYHGDADNFTLLRQPANVYTYIGFNLGYWDESLSQRVTDPDARMSSVDLRRAIWMALDFELVSMAWHHGLRWEANTLIPPTAGRFHAEHLQRPAFSVDAANALLDEAGFAFDGDYRTFQDGSEMILQYHTTHGNATTDAIDMFIIDSLADVGIRVERTLHDFGIFMPALREGNTADNRMDDMDFFMGAWSTGWNASPAGLYARNAAFNYASWTSETNDELLRRIDSPEAAVDPSYREQAMHEWQAYMLEYVPIFPTQFRLSFSPVNRRVLGASLHMGEGQWHQIQLTSDEPYVRTN